MNIPLSKMGLMLIIKCGKQNRGQLGKRRQRGDVHVFIIALLLALFSVTNTNNRKDNIFVPTDRVHLASKLDFSSTRIHKDSPATSVDNQATGKLPVPKDKGLFSHSTHLFNQHNRFSQKKDSKFNQKPKSHEESLQVKYNTLRSDFNMNSSDFPITQAVLSNTGFRSDNKLCDYEQDAQNVFVKGSLGSKLEYWKDIGASDFIFDVIENGYKLPFRTIPNKAEF